MTRTCNACVYLWSQLTMHEKPPRFLFRLSNFTGAQWCDSHKITRLLHSQFLRSLTHARISFPIATMLYLHNRQKSRFSSDPLGITHAAMRSLLDSTVDTKSQHWESTLLTLILLSRVLFNLRSQFTIRVVKSQMNELTYQFRSRTRILLATVLEYESMCVLMAMSFLDFLPPPKWVWICKSTLPLYIMYMDVLISNIDGLEVSYN